MFIIEFRKGDDILSMNSDRDFFMWLWNEYKISEFMYNTIDVSR